MYNQYMYILIILLCVVFIYKITIREIFSSPNCGKGTNRAKIEDVIVIEDI